MILRNLHYRIYFPHTLLIDFWMFQTVSLFANNSEYLVKLESSILLHLSSSMMCPRLNDICKSIKYKPETRKHIIAIVSVFKEADCEMKKNRNWRLSMDEHVCVLKTLRGDSDEEEAEPIDAETALRSYSLITIVPVRMAIVV